MALPKEMVVCVTGDGGIQMNIQSCRQPYSMEPPVLVLKLNNRYLGMVKQWQDGDHSGRHSQSYMQSLRILCAWRKHMAMSGCRLTVRMSWKVNSAKP